jgi:hypothetical protein
MPLRLISIATFPISISGLVVEYSVAIDVARVRFPADVFHALQFTQPSKLHSIVHAFWDTCRYGASHDLREWGMEQRSLQPTQI